MFRRVYDWMYRFSDAGRRRYDTEILWQTLKEQATDIEAARTAFRLHASVDPAWERLTNDEIDRIVDGLE